MIKFSSAFKRLKLLWILVFVLPVYSQEQDRPNILLFIVEDMSDFYLPAYGNTIIQTPNINRISNTANSIVFDNGYSNGAACSPARSTLITGVYASVIGAEQHRYDTEYPHEFFWTQLMQDSGYWTSNKGKTDYNIKNESSLLTTLIWNSTTQTFQNAPSNIPFFCVENNFDTHMSKITDTRNIAVDRPASERTVALDDVVIPNYLPDLNLIRDDMAWYYDRIAVMDEWLGTRLDALESSGRADDTIIFFMADNGGSMAGSKAFLRQDGMKVPMMAYFPDNWIHLAPPSINGRSNAIVEFVDFPKSILDVAGVNIPDYMMGRAFFGDNQDPASDYAYGILANQGNYYIPSRAITDGNYKFIWHYNTVWSKGVRKNFQFQMPGFRAWEEAYRDETLSGIQAEFWEPAPTFELFDLNADPDEINNLADDPAYAVTLQDMKTALSQKIRNMNDLGFNPITLRDSTSTSNYYDIVRDRNINLEAIYTAAELASEAEAIDQDQLVQNLLNSNPTVRYWGAMGIARLAYHELITELPQEVYNFMALHNENKESRLMCALAAASVGSLCEANDVFTELLPDNMVMTFIATLKDPTPFAQLIYDTYLDQDSFPNRSALINVGIMDYSDLIDPSDNPTLDLSVLSASSVLDACNNETLCANEQGNFFNGDTSLSSDWTMLNGSFGTSVTLENNRLKIDYTSGNQGVERQFVPVVQNGSTLSFTINTEKNFLRTYAGFKNQTGDYIGGIIIGNNGDKLIGTVGTEASYLTNAPVVSNDILGETYTKNKDYTINISFDFTNQTYSAFVEGFEGDVANSVPFWTSSDNMASFDLTLVSIFNNSGAIYLDNLILTENLIDTQNFNDTLSLMESLIYNSEVGPDVDQYPQAAYDILYSYYRALMLPDGCNASQNDYDVLVAEMQGEINDYLDSLNSLSVNDFTINNEILLYPNPVVTNSVFNIKTRSMDFIGDNVTIELIDIAGKPVMQKHIKHQSIMNVELPANVGSGIYFVSITTGKNKQVKKLIVK